MTFSLVAAVVFLIAAKARESFFFFQWAGFPLADVGEGTLGLRPRRPCSLALGVGKGPRDGELVFLFEGGEVVSWPGQADHMRARLQEQLASDELLSLLTRTVVGSQLRAEVWPDGRLTRGDLVQALGVLASAGLGTFDVAVHAKGAQP